MFGFFLRNRYDCGELVLGGFSRLKPAHISVYQVDFWEKPTKINPDSAECGYLAGLPRGSQ